MTERKRVLVTGAAGRIGSAFVQEMADRYDFRLADRVDAVHDVLPGAEALVLNIEDADACVHAVQGIDVVLHLAADPSPEADFYTSLQPNNFGGTYNIFKAAADAGCERVVFASSVHALMGYPPDADTPVDAPIWPMNMYGVSKCFGEATARVFASNTELSAICVRIGAYHRPDFTLSDLEEVLSAYVSPRDLNQLLRRCIDTKGIDFAIVHGVSENRIQKISLAETEALLGYAPVDDGYELFGL